MNEWQYIIIKRLFGKIVFCYNYRPTADGCYVLVEQAMSIALCNSVGEAIAAGATT